jgi:phenol 2-monooxygenase
VLLEACFWSPDENGTIKLENRISIERRGLSRYQPVVLHQGRIEQFLLETIHEHSNIRVERATLPETLALIEQDDVYPITVIMSHLRKEDATQTQGSGTANGLYRGNLVKDDTEDLIRKGQEHASHVGVIKEKYVIGCDGAHSWTRKELGFQMEGEQTDSIWYD